MHRLVYPVSRTIFGRGTKRLSMRCQLLGYNLVGSNLVISLLSNEAMCIQYPGPPRGQVEQFAPGPRCLKGPHKTFNLN